MSFSNLVCLAPPPPDRFVSNFTVFFSLFWLAARSSVCHSPFVHSLSAIAEYKPGKYAKAKSFSRLDDDGSFICIRRGNHNVATDLMTEHCRHSRRRGPLSFGLI